MNLLLSEQSCSHSNSSSCFLMSLSAASKAELMTISLKLEPHTFSSVCILVLTAWKRIS